MTEASNYSAFAFGLVALITARILNWKKERLDIKTDFVRNAYLIIAFGIVPYGLYKVLPSEFITLSWIIVAVLYFVVSILLKNVKYRWMAIATFAVSAFYLLLFDLSNVNILYRVIALMFLSIASIIISIIYTSKSKNKILADETAVPEKNEDAANISD